MKPDEEINTSDGTKVTRRSYGFIKLTVTPSCGVGRDTMDDGNIEPTTRSAAIVFVYLGDVACNVH